MGNLDGNRRALKAPLAIPSIVAGTLFALDLWSHAFALEIDDKNIEKRRKETHTLAHTDRPKEKKEAHKEKGAQPSPKLNGDASQPSLITSSCLRASSRSRLPN